MNSIRTSASRLSKRRSRFPNWRTVPASRACLRRKNLHQPEPLDVAALTRMLPTTLRLRDDVKIASGNVTWHVESNPTDDGANRWTGSLQTEDVQVVRGERPIEWRLPLLMSFSLVDGHEVEVESINARSDFFSLSGNGKTSIRNHPSGSRSRTTRFFSSPK